MINRFFFVLTELAPSREIKVEKKWNIPIIHSVLIMFSNENTTIELVFELKNGRYVCEKGSDDGVVFSVGSTRIAKLENCSLNSFIFKVRLPKLGSKIKTFDLKIFCITTMWLLFQ